MKHRLIIAVGLFILTAGGSTHPQDSVKPAGKRALPRTHPRLFGSAEQIQALARSKPAVWSAVLRSAENGSPIAALRGRIRGFASQVTGDAKYARSAIADAMKIVAKGISTEHVEFEQRMWPVA